MKKDKGPEVALVVEVRYKEGDKPELTQADALALQRELEREDFIPSPSQGPSKR